MIAKDAIEKYIGLETIENVSIVPSLYDDVDIKIEDYLNREIDEDDVWFWKSGPKKKFRIEFKKDGYEEGNLEWRDGKWGWMPGYE